MIKKTYPSGYIKYEIESKKDYKKVVDRVEKGAELLKDKWFDNKYKVWVKKYEGLTQAMLDWEIEHNLLPL